MAERAALDLPPVLDSAAAGGLKDSLLALRGADVTVSGAAVEQAGALCLQTLVAAQALWRRDGKSFALVEPSPALADAARLAGLAGSLNLDPVLP